MTYRELLLEILEGINDVDGTGDTQVFSSYTAPRLRQLIEARLAQPEQEPVAWMTDREEMYFDKEDAFRYSDGFIYPLYTAPQPAQKPLTDEEIKRIEETTECVAGESWLRNLCRNIEAAHNIK